MADPHRDPDAARRDRTDPVPGQRFSENDTDLDSGPDREFEEDDENTFDNDEERQDER
jgi:hypothetical protein